MSAAAHGSLQANALSDEAAASLVDALEERLRALRQSEQRQGRARGPTRVGRAIIVVFALLLLMTSAGALGSLLSANFALREARIGVLARSLRARAPDDPLLTGVPLELFDLPP